jgi:hypothetical protein
LIPGYATKAPTSDERRRANAGPLSPHGLYRYVLPYTHVDPISVPEWEGVHIRHRAAPLSSVYLCKTPSPEFWTDGRPGDRG